MTGVDQSAKGQEKQPETKADDVEKAKAAPGAQELSEKDLDAATGGKTGGATHSFGGGGGTAFP